jgi:predicted GNAT family acetyltransferase
VKPKVPVSYSYSTAQAFLEALGPDFTAREVENHLILGVARALAIRPVRDTAFVSIRDAEGLAVAALLSPNRPLVIASNRVRADEAIGELARWLVERGKRLVGFIADVPHAEAFAREWERLGGDKARPPMRQRLHVLREVASVPTARGTLRQAEQGDLELLTQWQGAFNHEAMGQAPDPELRDALTRRLENGEMWIWEDGEPRSMVASARPTRRGIEINSVYTPTEWRGRGYATTSVAALSRHLLDTGRHFCVLYTDLGNPTSNAIYARIGYKPVSDSLFYTLAAQLPV